MNSAAAYRIGTDQATRLMSGALHQDFGHYRNPARQIAEATNSNERSARNWYDGINLPTLIPALRLATKAPTVKAVLDFLTAIDNEDGRAAALVKELSALDAAGVDGERQMTLFAQGWVRR